MPAKSPLYDRDFYAWSREQAELLRAGKLAEADIEHIAEEIDSMGRTEKRELISRLDVLLLHLLKWRYQPGKRSPSWEASISNQRDDVADHLDDNPSLKPLLPQALASAYRKARREAVAETGLALSTFPGRPRGRSKKCWTKSFGPGDAKMAESSDSPQVQAFMAAFHKLRHLVDDAPDLIVREAQQDMSLLKVCDEVSLAAHWLRQQERVRRELYVSSANPAFVSAWREYESNWAKPIMTALWLCTDGFDLRLPAKIELQPIAPLALHEKSSESRWNEVDTAARSSAGAVGAAIQEAERTSDAFKDDDPDHFAEVEDGVASWKSLVDEVGFDLAAVFRRRDLTPFIMIPRHVSKRHGAAEPLSLLTLLQQAQEAFIYGVPFASFALMRAILELLLKNHYPSSRTDLDKLKLEQLIDAARGLPQNIPPARLHMIRQLGNDVLHFKKVYFSKEQTKDVAKWEREVISHFLTLKTLIEHAPPLAGHR